MLNILKIFRGKDTLVRPATIRNRVPADFPEISSDEEELPETPRLISKVISEPMPAVLMRCFPDEQPLSQARLITTVSWQRNPPEVVLSTCQLSMPTKRTKKERAEKRESDDVDK